MIGEAIEALAADNTVKRLSVPLGDQVDFYFGWDCLGALDAALEPLEADHVVIVSDRTVQALHREAVLEALPRGLPVSSVTLPVGEAAKNLTVLEQLAEQVIGAGVTRRSVIVALGGGAAGNIAGLVAALLFRGIRLVHLPTTLIAAFDSVLSQKQAVNLTLGKNLVGTYHPPTLIFADLAFLSTLPERERRSGLYEAIKNALAIHPATIPELERLIPGCMRLEPAALTRLLELSVSAKSSLLRDDEHERGRGLLLEYGHTVGHAIELIDAQAARGAPIGHGDAVGIGMVVASRVAARVSGLSEAAVEAHDALLRTVGGPHPLPAHVTPDRIMEIVARDNKRGYRPQRDGFVDMVLLRELGLAAGDPELPLTRVSRALLADEVRALGGSSA